MGLKWVVYWVLFGWFIGSYLVGLLGLIWLVYWGYVQVILYAGIIQIMRLLVTGGCGFIGSNFINHYFNGQYTVNRNDKTDLSEPLDLLVNVDAMYYCASETNVHEHIRMHPHYVLEKVNVCRQDEMVRILRDYAVTHVIHFAAQSHVQSSFDDSLTFTQDNIVGTHTLLEAVRLYGGIQKFIHVSTDEVYGESVHSAKTEQSVLCPTNPYAATKAGAELIAQAYCHSYKLPIIITRGNNVYGPNQYPEKLIPRFIQLLQQGSKVTIQGDGSGQRGFLHVDDTVRAFQCILEHGSAGEIYNIGCDEHAEYSVLDIARLLISKIKGPTADPNDWIEYVPDRPFNDRRYFISNDKLKALGWTIEVPFLQGIDQLVMLSHQPC